MENYKEKPARRKQSKQGGELRMGREAWIFSVAKSHESEGSSLVPWRVGD